MKRENDMVERYIYASTKNLPRGSRADIERELRTLIDDLLEERCAGREPTEKDVRVVLTELGTPAEIREKYDTRPARALIGPEYYVQYKWALAVVLGAQALGVVLAQVLEVVTGERALSDMGLGLLAGLAWGLGCGFTAVTLLFAFFERRGVKLERADDTIENLPPVPQHSELIPRWESVAGLAMCALMLLVFLAFPQVICAVVDMGARMQRVTVFDIGALRAQWLWIALFGLAGMAREVFHLVEGRYTLRVLAADLSCAAVSALLACLTFLPQDLMNPTFLQVLRNLGMNDLVMGIFGNFQVFLLAVILFALVLDAVDSTVKVLRVRRSGSGE